MAETMNTSAVPVLCVVVPAYNEEAVLPHSAGILGDLLKQLIQENLVHADSYICFVNDGSKDATWSQIRELQQKDKVFRGINLSRNFGHQSALLAGLFTAEADIYVSIDADLQDDEQCIRDMVKAYHEGYDIVYGCRDNRDTDTWFKRTTALAFYRFRAMMGCNTIPNHADFRLMSRRSVEALKQFGEVNLFLRGIVPMLGFPSTRVTYARKAREAGESKYPLSKMLRLAWDGVVNFSEAPLYACLWLGVLGIFGSILLMAWVIWRWSQGETVPGWSSSVMLVSFFGSFQFFFLGVMGLYIGKIFKETKHRPVFIVQDDLTKKN